MHSCSNRNESARVRAEMVQPKRNSYKYLRKKPLKSKLWRLKLLAHQKTYKYSCTLYNSSSSPERRKIDIALRQWYNTQVPKLVRQVPTDVSPLSCLCRNVSTRSAWSIKFNRLIRALKRQVLPHLVSLRNCPRAWRSCLVVSLD